MKHLDPELFPRPQYFQLFLFGLRSKESKDGVAPIQLGQLLGEVSYVNPGAATNMRRIFVAQKERIHEFFSMTAILCHSISSPTYYYVYVTAYKCVFC
jgi:hypothetical protein